LAGRPSRWQRGALPLPRSPRSADRGRGATPARVDDDSRLLSGTWAGPRL